MQFQIPQFIETEDKIIGPLTLKQFAYLAIAGFICFMLFFILKTFIWVMLSVLLMGAAVALAFVHYNGQTMPVVLFSIFKYVWRPKFFLWVNEQKIVEPDISKIKVPRLKNEKRILPTVQKTTPIIKPEIAEENTVVMKENLPRPEVVKEKTGLLLKLAKLAGGQGWRGSSPKPAPEAETIDQKPTPEKIMRGDYIKEVEAAQPPAKKESGIKNLWIKLTTARESIMKREAASPEARAAVDQAKSKEIFEMFRKMTGEQQTARRVDYR